MRGIFDLIKATVGEEVEKPELTLGLRIKIGEHQTICPITEPSNSYDVFEKEAQTIIEDLSRIMEKAKDFFKGDRSSEGMLGFDEDMEPAQIWALLSEIEDVEQFVTIFNDLEEARRKEIAEHVLTHCNVFTGKASVFSARYNNESGFME